ncbi:MAG: ABC transporter ATP-binding protein [Thermoplasmata archaeon]|nr:MAG: ABC transporter ATP-binding protein [Thermoplasmata archaeon]
MNEAIVTENLTKVFGNFTAVNELNLRIEHGVCVGFLGPNGAGKTTTIKILTSMLRATNGNAYIEGVDVGINPKEALGRVGSVVETPEFYPYLTPVETLTYLGKIRGIASNQLLERIEHVIGEVKLQDWKDKRIGKFSKGMKQRLAIAQALLHEPPILILDEPTTGLDPRGMVEVREIIKLLKTEGRTIFMSSHLLFEVQEVCDKVAMINKGQLLTYDEIEKLANLAEVVKVEVQILSPITPEQVKAIQDFNSVKNLVVYQPHLFVVELEGREPEKAELLANIQNVEGISVTSFRAVGTALENLYMSMISDSI